jgi:hypothetical protein
MSNDLDSPAEREYRSRLQRAVRSEELPPYLEARMRANLAKAPARSWWRAQWAGAAAAVVVVAGGVIAYQLGDLRLSVASQDSYISSVSQRVATIMRVGLKDHIHCAYFRKYPKNPPTMQTFVEKMGPQYAGLIPIVRDQVPGRFRLEIAHICGYKGRKYVHMVMRYRGELVSFIVTRKEAGESFQTEGLLPALIQSEIPYYQTSVQGFHVASFESKDHLVFLISGLSDGETMQQLAQMAPRVKQFLEKAEL